MTGQSSNRRRALGKGLDALIPARGGPTKRDYFFCPIEKITARKDQPRRRFDEKALDELADSIREQGIIQPLVVRSVDEGFEIIAGERRWRAAQRSGLHQVPVVVQNVTPSQAFEMALVENLQREDLNPLERAEAYQRLVDEHGLKQEDLAKRIGKGRSTITNSLRLLNLPKIVRDFVMTGELSEGHARALLSIQDEKELVLVCKKVIKQGLSVRQTERLVKSWSKEEKPKSKKKVNTPQIRHLETRLRQSLGCIAKLKDKDGKGHQGTLELRYTSSEQLEKILDLLLEDES